MRRGTGTHANSTKAGEALSNGLGPSFVPWREETKCHDSAKRRVPTPPPGGVTDAVSELIDHTLYAFLYEVEKNILHHSRVFRLSVI
jgi:hypothetical protein